MGCSILLVSLRNKHNNVSLKGNAIIEHRAKFYRGPHVYKTSCYCYQSLTCQERHTFIDLSSAGSPANPLP